MFVGYPNQQQNFVPMMQQPNMFQQPMGNMYQAPMYQQPMPMYNMQGNVPYNQPHYGTPPNEPIPSYMLYDHSSPMYNPDGSYAEAPREIQRQAQIRREKERQMQERAYQEAIQRSTPSQVNNPYPLGSHQNPTQEQLEYGRKVLLNKPDLDFTNEYISPFLQVKPGCIHPAVIKEAQLKERARMMVQDEIERDMQEERENIELMNRMAHKQVDVTQGLNGSLEELKMINDANDEIRNSIRYVDIPQDPIPPWIDPEEATLMAYYNSKAPKRVIDYNINEYDANGNLISKRPLTPEEFDRQEAKARFELEHGYPYGSNPDNFVTRNMAKRHQLTPEQKKILVGDGIEVKDNGDGTVMYKGIRMPKDKVEDYDREMKEQREVISQILDAMGINDLDDEPLPEDRVQQTPPQQFVNQPMPNMYQQNMYQQPYQNNFYQQPQQPQPYKHYYQPGYGFSQLNLSDFQKMEDRSYEYQRQLNDPESVKSNPNRIEKSLFNMDLLTDTITFDPNDRRWVEGTLEFEEQPNGDFLPVVTNYVNNDINVPNFVYSNDYRTKFVGPSYNQNTNTVYYHYDMSQPVNPPHYPPFGIGYYDNPEPVGQVVNPNTGNLVSVYQNGLACVWDTTFSDVDQYIYTNRYGGVTQADKIKRTGLASEKQYIDDLVEMSQLRFDPLTGKYYNPYVTKEEIEKLDATVNRHVDRQIDIYLDMIKNTDIAMGRSFDDAHYEEVRKGLDPRISRERRKIAQTESYKMMNDVFHQIAKFQRMGTKHTYTEAHKNMVNNFNHRVDVINRLLPVGLPTEQFDEIYSEIQYMDRMNDIRDSGMNTLVGIMNHNKETGKRDEMYDNYKTFKNSMFIEMLKMSDTYNPDLITVNSNNEIEFNLEYDPNRVNNNKMDSMGDRGDLKSDGKFYTSLGEFNNDVFKNDMIWGDMKNIPDESKAEYAEKLKREEAEVAEYRVNVDKYFKDNKGQNMSRYNEREKSEIYYKNNEVMRKEMEERKNQLDEFLEKKYNDNTGVGVLDQIINKQIVQTPGDMSYLDNY